MKYNTCTLIGTMDADNPISKNDEIKLDCNVTRYNF